MSTNDTILKLDERKVLRKGLGQLRRDGLVPAVVHNHGNDSLHVMAPAVQLAKIYKDAGKHHPLDLQVDGKHYLALIKDVQYESRRRTMQHVVFQAISQTEKVEAEVPVRLDGDPPAERLGLIVLHQLDHVIVKALPKNLPDEFRVDALKLAELGDKIMVADLVAPEGVTIETEPDHPIATVAETRAQVAEEEAEEEEDAEATEEGEASAEATEEE